MLKISNRAIWGVFAILVLSLSVANVSQVGVTEVDLSTAVGIWLFGEDSKDNFVKTSQKLLDSRVEFSVLCWVNLGKLTGERIGLVGQNDSPEFGFSNPN